MKRIVWVLFAAACSAPPPAAVEAPIASTNSRWERVTVPRGLALLEAPARLVAEEIATGEVTVLFPARVERVLVAPGDRVEAGQPVAEVVVTEINRAAAALVGIDAQLGLVEARLAALKELQVERLVRAEELFDLEHTRGRLVAERAQALATLSTSGVAPSRAEGLARRGRLTLDAPLAGVVARVDARIGGFAAEGVALVEIRGTRRVRVEATLTSPLPASSKLEFVASTGARHRLVTEPLASIVDAETGQTRVWLALAEPTALAAGQRGRVVARPDQGALVQIPSAAVVHDEGGAIVYVVEGDTPTPKAVQVVVDSGTSALVSGPLEVGAMVVVDPVVETP